MALKHTGPLTPEMVSRKIVDSIPRDALAGADQWLNSQDQSLQQYRVGQTFQAGQAGQSQTSPPINPSDYNINDLIAEQARLELLKDNAEKKHIQAQNELDDICRRVAMHQQLIGNVITATVQNIKKVLK